MATTRTYRVEGQLFLASADDFSSAFDTQESLDMAVVDVSGAHVWDISSVAALDGVVLKFRRAGTEVQLAGLNAASETIVDRLAIHDKQEARERATAH